MLDALKICSPKRNSRGQTGWDGFFPYYAGYSETFARGILTSAKLGNDAVVFDPWNGSGTTTYAASLLGLTSRGFDLNPVMVIVARARLLVIRAIERSIRQRLVGAMTMTPTGTHFERISGLAATFYVALFTLCRELAMRFRSSNPTWLRQPKETETRIGVSQKVIADKLLGNLRSMAAALAARTDLFSVEQGISDIRVADTTTMTLPRSSIDFVLTSPPYCTRIDYTAATRVELALLAPFIQTPTDELGRQMIGSTRVPHRDLHVSPSWGARCAAFLEALRKHPSKASAGYYYRTHLDYFDKIARSIYNIAVGLKRNGSAVFVVQDSYYKNLHNELPSIVADIAHARGLAFRRREDFQLSRTMAGINRHTQIYKRAPGAVEAVLCFQKQ